MNESALRGWLAVAEEAARAAAAVLEDWRGRFRVSEKGPADLVTDADFAAQRAVRATLDRRCPGHGFVGEEEGMAGGQPPADAPPTWIVDPLDGTTNYVHDCPMYCVSIGLYVAGRAAVGVVYDPRQNELFAAAHGLGATLNGRSICCSQTKRIDHALLATGFAPSPDATRRALRGWDYLAYRAQSLRRTGTTAMNLAYVACGRFDGYWAYDNHPWDVAAGVVLIREAGGTVTHTDGTDYDPFRPDIIAGSAGLYPALAAAVTEASCEIPY